MIDEDRPTGGNGRIDVEEICRQARGQRVGSPRCVTLQVAPVGTWIGTVSGKRIDKGGACEVGRGVLGRIAGLRSGDAA
jgi:hypothetical protein